MLIKLKIRDYIFIVIALIISFLLVKCDFTTKSKEPYEVYRIYLKGKSLGFVESKKELEKYIDKKQESVKKKYKVSKVYVPEELDIIKEVTFNEKISSVKSIYEKIKDIEPFTIDGYEVTIKGLTKRNDDGKDVKEKNKNIYMLDDNVFKDAVNHTVQSFITKEKYDEYKDDDQKEIKDTGSIIENLYIKNKISIKKKRIPVNEKIYLDKDEMTKYLLFGTTEEQKKYTVKDGDTIEDVAFNNKISTEEFLVANTNIKDKNSLLYSGQEVTIGILHPQFDLVEEDHTVSDVDVNYETETKYDNSKSVGYSQVEQAGVKGKNRVTQKIQKVNGETTSVVTVQTEQLSEPVKEIVVKGGKESDNYSGSGYGSVVPTKGEWGWPATCTSISSPFGYRWGTLHNGTDIAGCGFGSNIFAAQSGTVVESQKKTGSYPGGYGQEGEYIVIDHHNGYYTLYAHMCTGCRKVKVGDNVVKGQVIGGMGKTGAATGVHVHFSMFIGYPYHGGRVINAMGAY